ncbi:chemotaxis response regulator protein-glutamate methylesterase [Timonella senegalensis]|uniref:protein-glutamate methylesterase/protein-glutamine glutaminase n=2 Tax=Timonella senegalensis TaxID=1465825 RepID=UPI002FDCA79F
MTIRALVVDDSVVIRRLVVQVLEAEPDFEVVGMAANGKIALTKTEQLNPDIVIMDVEMPEMNGIEAVRELRKRGTRTPIIMFSTLTERGALATIDALSAGASDYVAKPSNMGSVTESLHAVAEQLVPKIRALVSARRQPRSALTMMRTSTQPATTATGTGLLASQNRRESVAAPAAPTWPAPQLRPTPKPHPIRAVVLGCSTGGPEALSRVVAGLIEPLPVPVVVVQHMPPVFTKQLAARLNNLGPHRVTEAQQGEELRAGTIHIAPGDWHLKLAQQGVSVTCELVQSEPVNYCRPSVDVLFQSAHELYGGELLSVVLTGMGADGRAGAGLIAQAGGTVIVQDQATSVVWGMPGAVATAGFAHRIVPIDEIAPTIARVVAATQRATGQK